MTIRPTYLIPVAGFAAGWLFAFLQTPSSTLPERAHGNNSKSVVEIGGQDSQPSSRELKSQSTLSAQLTRESLRQSLSHASELHRLGAFASMLDNLNAAQFAALYAELSAIDPQRQSSVRALFFRRWALVAPEAALDVALKEDMYFPVFTAWAERDPEAALARFDKTTSITGFTAQALRDDIRELAMPKPGQLPPATAMKRIQELQGEGRATPAVFNSMAGIVRQWADTDPQAAWQEALALPSTGNEKELRDWTLRVLVEKRAGTDPDGVLRWINALPESERGTLESQYVGALSGAGKTHQAREYAMAMPEGAARRSAVGALARSLFTKDDEAAKAFISALPDSDWQDPSIFSDVFGKWLLSDSERATEVLLKRIPANPPAGPKQQRAYEEMFAFWSGRHPREASDFLLKLPESIGASELTKSVSYFTFQDPAAAGEWAASLPVGASRDKLLTQVASEWAGSKVTEVPQWIDRLPQDSGKSAAIEGFAKAIISTSPDDALTWIQSVPDKKDRIERLCRVWRQWTDREAALKWAEACPQLSEGERKALREINAQ